MFTLAHIGFTLTGFQVASLSSERRTLLSPAEAGMVMLGSMLPDFLDKPLGYLFLPHLFGNGRSIAHSLAFFGALLVAAAVAKKIYVWPIALSAGVHLILDAMWKTPAVLFWPFHGIAVVGSYSPGLACWVKMMAGIARSPEVFVPEAIGFFLLATNAFAYSAVRSGRQS